MGAVNCQSAIKRDEETKLEADISLVSHSPSMIKKTRTIYQTFSTRIFAAKDELYSLYHKEQLPLAKNYDSYYGFLSTYIIPLPNSSHCSTSGNSEEIQIRGPRPEKGFVMPAPALSLIQTSKKDLIVARKNESRTKSRARNSKPPINIAIESPKKPQIPNQPKSAKPSLDKNLSKNRNSTQLDTLAKSPKTILQMETRKRMSTCIMRNNKKVQLDIISLLPENIVNCIFSYVIEQFPRYLLVSVSWYASLLGSLDMLFNPIEVKLAQVYINCILFHNSYTSFTKQEDTPIYKSRVDRVMQLELLPGLVGKTLQIGFTYKYCNEPNTTYMTTYKIDCKNSGERLTVWIHKSKIDQYGKISSHNATILPICTGDLFEISIHYYTLRGLIDISTFSWCEPELEITPIVSIFESNFKGRNSLTAEQIRILKENMGRICELELMYGEWYDTLLYENKDCNKVNLYGIAHFFEILSIEYVPVDPKVKKITLKPYKTGIFSLRKSKKRIGGKRSFWDRSFNKKRE